MADGTVSSNNQTVTTNTEHLTELDFDISKIEESLHKIENYLADTVKKIHSDPKYKLSLDFSIGDLGSASIKEETNKIKKVFDENINDLSSDGFVSSIAKAKDEIDDTTIKVRELIEQYGDLAKVQTKVDSSGKVVGATVTYDDKQGQSIVASYELQEKAIGEVVDGVQQYQLVWNNTGNVVTDNIQKTNNILEKQEKQIQSLIDKQKQQINVLKSYPSNTFNVDEFDKAYKNLDSLNEMMDKTSSGEVFSKNQNEQLQTYSKNIKDVDSNIKNVDKSADNFLGTISDKARWLAAFYLIDSVKNAFFDTIDVIKDTEMAVVDLQRVLNDPSLGDVTIQDQLYGIAGDYGRIFSDVSDTATKFAQTGANLNETLQLTEATMLAVNTAELEVETATTGLIAVMSQFNIETTDMIGVIDKINITADNFAVTSEKIVAALQRTGSAAVNANLSLEDTISLITSMSEATGRSGETIGTALNSLLVYSQRSSSLDVFAGLSDSMEETVAKLRKGSLSITELWSALSKQLAQDDSIAKALATQLESDQTYEQFAADLESEAMELTESIKETYATAGTHRQNYFIALLDNMDTYTDALGQMGDSEGYSLAENEKYMNTLTAQYNTLMAEVKALGVAFGEAGFLEFLKTLVQIGIGATDLVESLGGVRTVALAVSGVLLTMQASKVKNFFDGVSDAVSLAGMKIVEFGSNAKAGFKLVTTGAKESQDAVEQINFNTQIAAFKSLVTLGITGVVTALSLWIQKQEEARQKAIESSNEYLNQIDSLEALKKQYEDLEGMTDEEAENSEELAELKRTLIEVYGLEEEALKSVNEVRSQGIDLINKEMQTDYAKWYQENYKQIEKAREVLNQPIGDVQFSYFEETEKQVKDIIDTYDSLNLVYERLAEGSTKVGTVSIAGDDLYEQRDNLLEIIQALDQKKELEVGEVVVLTELRRQWEMINEKIGTHGELYDSAHTAQVSYYKSLLGSQVEEIANMENLQDRQRGYTEILNTIRKDSQITGYELEELGKWLEDALNTSVTSDAPEQIEQLAYDSEAAAERIEALTNSIDSAQSAFSSILGVMDSYNETGVFSIDMVQQLMSLSGEYASMLSLEGGQLQFVDQRTGQVINSKQALIASYIEEQTAAQVASLAESLYAEQLIVQQQESATSAGSNATLATSFNDVITQALKGAISIAGLSDALSEFGSGQGLEGDFLNQFTTGANQIIANAQNMYAQIGSIASSPSTWGGGSGGAISSAGSLSDEVNERRIDQLEHQKKLIEDNVKVITDGLEKEIDEINKMNDALSEGVDERIAEIESRYNAEIDGLKEVQEENDRVIAQEEYLNSLADAKQELASAEARAGVEYREQEEQARQTVDDVETDWDRQREDWDTEDEIEELEAMRDAEIGVLEEIQKKFDDMAERQINAIQGTIDALNEQKQVQLDLIETQTEALRDGQDIDITSTLQSTTGFMTGLTQEYVDGLVNSTMQLQSQNELAMSQMADNILNSYTSQFIAPAQSQSQELINDLVPTAQTSFDSMYTLFKSNFIDKASTDIDNMFLNAISQFNQMSGFGVSTSGGPGVGGAQNTYNNSNRSASNYINVNNRSDLNNVRRTLDDFFA